MLGCEQCPNYRLPASADIGLDPGQQIRVHPAQERLELPALAAVIAELLGQAEHADALPALPQAREIVWIIWGGAREATQPTQLPGHITAGPQRLEIFFGIITRQAIRRGTFRNVKDLTAVIGRFIDAYNQRCQPFAWTKGAGQILAKASRPSPRAPGGSHSSGSAS